MGNKKKRIAIVYEGERTEKRLIQNMLKIFFSEHTEILIFTFPACGNIYMIWNELRKNDFDIDVIDAIREISPEGKKLLAGYSAREFSEIYLFFDYDAHNDNLPLQYRDSDIVHGLLKTFDNETENGKLYISYPMIESLREINSAEDDYRTFYVPMDNREKYKQYVSEELEFRDFRHITKKQWRTACRASARRANLIVNNRDRLPIYRCFINELTQIRIYEEQLRKFVRLNRLVGVLNSVPLFLLEYFKEEFWDEIIS